MKAIKVLHQTGKGGGHQDAFRPSGRGGSLSSGTGVAVRRELQRGQDVVIAFIPAKEGVLAFACGTGMYIGTMVVD